MTDNATATYKRDFAGISPAGGWKGIIHLTCEPMPMDQARWQTVPMQTLCGRRLALLSMRERAEQDRHCKVCQRKALKTMGDVAHAGERTLVARRKRAESGYDTIVSIAGDLWNELENLRDYWQGTDRAPLVEGYIADYEKWAST